MRSLWISLLVFVCLLVGAGLGLFLRRCLPQHHLSTDSKDAVKLGMGLIATMAALVLSLLIASTKTAYDTQNAEVRQMAASLVMLDRLLDSYGNDAKEIRSLLRRAVANVLEHGWRQGDARSTAFENPTVNGISVVLFRRIEELSPANDIQRAIKDQAAEILKTLSRERWQLVTEGGSAIPLPFLAVLIFWLVILFVSFGLFAPPNATVIATFIVCAMSVAGAIFLIVELDRPFEGLMQISSEPFRKVLE